MGDEKKDGKQYPAAAGEKPVKKAHKEKDASKKNNVKAGTKNVKKS